MNIVTVMSASAAETVHVDAFASIQHTVEPIALNRLVPSKANVRRVNAAVGVSELADSIEAHGLIHNLTVRKAKKGRYEVIAGSRRLAALRLLAKEGRLADDVEIPCNMREEGSDTEISLADNVQREVMHVVDEILAYRQLAEGGMPPESIAVRFGQSVITVRQRLKLAHLSPKLLDVMREDGLTIEQARALALSDSHEEQEGVWFGLPDWNREPRSIRAMLTQEHVRSTDRLARFVGLPDTTGFDPARVRARGAQSPSSRALLPPGGRWCVAGLGSHLGVRAIYMFAIPIEAKGRAKTPISGKNRGPRLNTVKNDFAAGRD